MEGVQGARASANNGGAARARTRELTHTHTHSVVTQMQEASFLLSGSSSLQPLVQMAANHR